MSAEKQQELVRGLEGIAPGETAISSLAGGLSYRGYAVEDLAQHATYEEVAYLLLHGHAADAQQLAAFRQRIAGATTLPDEFWRCLYNVPRTTLRWMSYAPGLVFARRGIPTLKTTHPRLNCASPSG